MYWALLIQQAMSSAVSHNVFSISMPDWMTPVPGLKSFVMNVIYNVYRYIHSNMFIEVTWSTPCPWRQRAQLGFHARSRGDPAARRC